ncbi:hypothetical protein DQ397_004243 [Pseudomonas sp. CK-NBRI-02]|uniref:hypothetical protein n=1 Tax=Pseudomonas sp. CK-NBRI-02 TaxID=2249759 RepID=UPI0005B7B239|nr:hypothetical protein [Pseudomonas sp. CK-NBRI-02]TYO70656.1 hypothetical protein DQ397_004243 [Pseudomonas sp. CK-NBRI-02]
MNNIQHLELIAHPDVPNAFILKGDLEWLFDAFIEQCALSARKSSNGHLALHRKFLLEDLRDKNKLLTPPQSELFAHVALMRGLCIDDASYAQADREAIALMHRLFPTQAAA